MWNYIYKASFRGVDKAVYVDNSNNLVPYYPFSFIFAATVLVTIRYFILFMFMYNLRTPIDFA